MVGMTFTDRAKHMADTALEWVEEHSGQVGAKVVEVAEQVRERAPGYVDRATDLVQEKAPGYADRAAGLADQVRGKAPGYVDRAAEFAGRAADATAAGVDRATAGRWHDRIDKAHEKVEETLDRRTGSPADAPGGTVPDGTVPGSTSPDSTLTDATGTAPGPVGDDPATR